MPLTDDQIERYSRHILLKAIGGTGQEKLLSSRVLIVGAGGLGSPAAYYLAAAGVGTIGLIDDDYVELSNLQRQIAHFTDDIGKKKVQSVKEKLIRLNPGIDIQEIPERIHVNNISDLIETYDFVIDGTDNFASKYLINDTCVMNKIPFSHAGISRFDGMTMTYVPGTACYRCLFPDAPDPGSVPTCSEAGILGVVAGSLGIIQASEAIKTMLGIGTLLTNRILTVDVLNTEYVSIQIQRNESCPVCGQMPTSISQTLANQINGNSPNQSKYEDSSNEY